jgi:probable HAF family extracellular repeat protein
VVEAGNQVATIGKFVNNRLQLTSLPNPNPAEIEGYWDFQIDEANDVLGFGYQEVILDGWLSATLSRAVIWPAAGGAIDLGAQTGIASTEGNGIASVNGVMQVVGRAEDDGRSAFAYRYTNGKLQDLNTLAAGDQPWNLAHGEGVNRSGMICGFGKVGGRRTGQWHGFLLIPNQ